MTDEEMLKEIFKIYKPVESSIIVEYRVYYDPETLEILHFSQEQLPYPYCCVTKEVYETYRPDLFKIEDNKVVAKEQSNSVMLQLSKGQGKFASLPNNIQFAVGAEYTGNKTTWK
jgi:hypothetical protein